MFNRISCRQVKAILPFYIKGSVNPFVSDLIEDHLETCESCKKLYLKLLDEYNKEFIPDFENVINDCESAKSDENYVTNEYRNFKKKLSAYFDSELDNKEQIQMKKLTISNPLARRDFENLFKFKQLLHSSFEKTKSTFNKDYSYFVIKKLLGKKILNHNLKAEISLGLVFVTIIISLIIIYRF